MSLSDAEIAWKALRIPGVAKKNAEKEKPVPIAVPNAVETIARTRKDILLTIKIREIYILLNGGDSLFGESLYFLLKHLEE